LTGSDTSSNALFSNLQKVTAQHIGVNPILTIAANTTGGVTGKMISPQSIAVACAATGLVGHESELFRFTVKHSLFFATLIGIITYIQAYYLSWMIPVVGAH
jgi:L-lactate permease